MATLDRNKIFANKFLKMKVSFFKWTYRFWVIADMPL